MCLGSDFFKNGLKPIDIATEPEKKYENIFRKQTRGNDKLIKMK